MQIREEEKLISKKEFAQYLDVTEERIDELIDGGFLPQTMHDGKCYPGLLLAGLKKGGVFPYVSIGSSGTSYFTEIINSALVIAEGGVFVVPARIHPSRDEGITNLIKSYGVWEAQSKNNLINLIDIVENPVYQIILANEIIDVWGSRIKAQKLPRECVVYWSGISDSTLTIYLSAGKDESFFETHEKQSGIKNVLTRQYFNHQADCPL